MQKFKISSIISFLIILITVISVNQWSTFRFVFTDNSSVFPIYFITLFLIVYCKKDYYNPHDNKNLAILFIYTSWIIICVIRGAFVADNRAEWINLINNACALLMPLIVFSFTNPIFVQKILSSWFQYIIPIYLIFIIFFMQVKVSGSFLYPFTIALIGFTALPTKWKWASAICVFIMLLNFDARSHVIKYSIAFLFGLMYYRKQIFTKRRLNLLNKIFMVFPIVLFVLGVIGIFNVLNMSKYTSSDYKVESNIKGKDIEVSLIEDTRTFLYTEVIGSAINNKYIWFGRTPARGNDTSAFSYIADVKYGSGKAERPSNEAAILNTFTWTGVVGVVLYFLVFLIASNLAINKSNNYYMKIIGLYVSFRWLYAWVEDFQKFDILNITLWIMIIMCFSSSFRLMSDREFKIWIKGIFNWRYRRMKINYLKNYLKSL